MQSNDPGQQARPDPPPPPPQQQQQQQQPSQGGSGEGAASAYARMKSQLEQLAGEQPAEPLRDTGPP